MADFQITTVPNTLALFERYIGAHGQNGHTVGNTVCLQCRQRFRLCQT